MTTYLSNLLASPPNNPSESFSHRTGFLQAAADSSVAIAAAVGVGHVFGRFGQGLATLPDGDSAVAPFYWGTIEAGKRPGMYLSIYPEADAETGLTGTTDTIVFSAMAKEFAALSSFGVPAVPSADADPEAELGSIALSASMVAVATALVSLY